MSHTNFVSRKMRYCYTDVKMRDYSTVSVNISNALLAEIKQCVERGLFANRTEFIRAAVLEKLHQVRSLQKAREADA